MRKYCVAEVSFINNNPVLRYRAYDKNETPHFYWSDDIKDPNVVWGDEEKSKAFAILKHGRALIPSDCVN